MLAVLMLDLDNFKQVNDTLGHLIGDELLKESVKRIHSVISRTSDIVARFGGDEFIILLSPISKKEDVSFIAQKICNELARPFYIEKNTIEISSSIGIAIYPEHGSNKTELISNADKALYNVKNRHKNGFEFFDLGNKIV